MQEFTVNYESPLGMIRLVSDGLSIKGAHFMDGNLQSEQSHDDLLLECIRQLDGYFEGTLKDFSLPINQPGTVFQLEVWKELNRIPYGKTISYLQLSKNLGNTRAIRAAGTANGKNNVAILVPCHRVIGSDGSLTGYSGGLWRKQWLLEHEAKFSNGVQTLF